jgi:Tfp pilus assembly protein PilF
MIVKLHGDHHLAALNTQEETAALDEQLGAPVRSLLFDRGLVFVGYGGRDKGILELLESLPDDALRYGVYWVNGTQPDGDVASWLAKREALWVDHHDFDELMVLFKDVFALPDPDRSQIDDTFDSIQRAYIALSSQIRESSSSDPDASALRAAVARLDASLSDWGAVEIKAQQFKRHDPDKAASIYEEGIARLPHSVPLIGNYANLLKDQGKLDIADEMYRRALAIDPNHAPVLADYGVFLWRCRNAPNLAEEYLQRARTADPSLAHNLANLASFLYQERGAFEQAAQLFRDAQSINSDDPDILGLYAQFLVNARNDYMRGLMFYQRALDLNPAHLGNLINYAALVPQVTEDLDIAVVAYGRALALDENNPTLLVNYADFLWHNVHDADRAEAAYRKALQAAPEDQHINGAFASFLWEARGDVETARRLFTEASTSGSLGRYFALNYAKFLDKVDHDLEGAEQQYMKAVDRFPEDAVVLGNAGAFLEQALNDKERAAELYRRAIYADPHNIIAQTNLAGLLLERGQQDEGLSLLGSTFRLIGHSATAAAVEAWFYLFVYGDVERRQSALEGLYRALARGARSEEWNLDRHVVIGTAMNHPDAEYLPMLASVIAGREDLSILRNWKAWQDLEESVAP